MKKALLFLSVILVCNCLFAQETANRHAVPGHRYLKEYWGQSELYLEHQAYYMLDLADKALNENPPATSINLEREMALLMIDAVTHEPTPIENPAVLDFLSRRISHVVEDLEGVVEVVFVAMGAYSVDTFEVAEFREDDGHEAGFLQQLESE